MDNLAPRAREYWCVREFQDAGDGGRTPDELARQIVRSATDARPSALLSFDFEDWYQLACRDLGMIEPHRARQAFERQVQLVLDLLDEIEATATFFVLGMSAERHPELVCELVARKHEVACHGHEHFRVFAQTEQEFRYDVERAIDAIAGTVGRPPRGYRAPWCSINRDTLWAYAVLCDLGLEYDSSQYDAPLVRRRLRSIPRGPYRIVLPSGASLLELPISIWGVGGLSLPIGGGAYWRAMPPALVRHGLSQVARSGALLTLYFHPHEFDDSALALPRVRLAAHPRLRVRYSRPYANAGRGRIAPLIRSAALEFRFMSYEQLRTKGAIDVRSSARALSTEGVLV